MKSNDPETPSAAKMFPETYAQMTAAKEEAEAALSARDQCETRMKSIAEREAACCPEDVPFDEYILTLRAKLVETRAVLQTCIDQWRAPGEGHSVYYDRQAQRFYHATGFMAPGKSVPAAMGAYDETARDAAWRDFFDRPYREAVRVLAGVGAEAQAAVVPRRDEDLDRMSDLMWLAVSETPLYRCGEWQRENVPKMAAVALAVIADVKAQRDSALERLGEAINAQRVTDSAAPVNETDQGAQRPDRGRELRRRLFRDQIAGLVSNTVRVDELAARIEGALEWRITRAQRMGAKAMRETIASRFSDPDVVAFIRSIERASEDDAR